MPNLPVHLSKRIPLATISNDSSSTSPSEHFAKPPMNRHSQSNNPPRQTEPRKSSLRRQSANEPLTNNVEVSGKKGHASMSNKRVSFGGENINFIYTHPEAPSPKVEPPQKKSKKSVHSSPNQQFSSGPHRGGSPLPPKYSYPFASLDDSDEEREDDDGDENNEDLPAAPVRDQGMSSVEKPSPLAPQNDFVDTHELRSSFGLFRDEDGMPEAHTDETEGSPGDATQNLTGWDISSRRRSSAASAANDGDITNNMLGFDSLLDFDENDDIRHLQRNMNNDKADAPAAKIEASKEGKDRDDASDDRSDITLSRFSKGLDKKDDQLQKPPEEQQVQHKFGHQQDASMEEDVDDSCITLPPFGSHVAKETKQIGAALAPDQDQSRRFSDESNFSADFNFLLEKDEADDANFIHEENAKAPIPIDQDYSKTPRKLFDVSPRDEDETLHWPEKSAEKKSYGNALESKIDGSVENPSKPPTEKRNPPDVNGSHIENRNRNESHGSFSQKVGFRAEKNGVSLSPIPVAHEMSNVQDDEIQREDSLSPVHNVVTLVDKDQSYPQHQVQNINTHNPPAAMVPVEIESSEKDKNQTRNEDLGDVPSNSSPARVASQLINDKASVQESEHIREIDSNHRSDLQKDTQQVTTSTTPRSRSGLIAAQVPEEQASQSSQSTERNPIMSASRHLSVQGSALRAPKECATKPCTFSNFIQGLRAFGISLDLPSISGRDSSLLPPEPDFHRFDRSTMEGQILDGARKQTILNVLNEQIRGLRAMAERERESLKQAESQLEEKQPAIFKKICNVELLEKNERTIYGLSLKRLRKVCTLQAKMRWVESRKVWEEDIIKKLRSLEIGLVADKKALQHSHASLMTIARNSGAPLVADENENRVVADENAIVARRTVVHELSSLRDLHRYVTSQTEEERELQSTNARLKARKEELIRQLEPLESFAEADNAGKLRKLLIEQRELNMIVSGVSGISLLHVSPQRIDIRVASCMDVQLSIHSEKVINVSCKAVYVRSTRPAYWKEYIDAIVGIAISTSQLRSIKLLRDVTPSLFAASEFLTRTRFALEEAEAYCSGNVAEITKAGLHSDIHPSNGSSAAQVEIQASFFCVKTRCKFDLRAAHIVSVENRDVRDINQAIELYEVDHIIGNYPSGKNIREVIMKGSENFGNMVSLRSGLNRLWTWLDKEDDN